MKEAFLKDKEERRLERGHLWAYRNEIRQLPELEDGELVDLLASNGRLVGRGFYQAEGGIAVRLLTRSREETGRDFFLRRVRDAADLRRRFFPGAQVWRWLHGEADYTPGLVADRYDRVVMLRSSCAFYDSRAEMLADVFLEQDGIEGVCFAGVGETRRFGDAPEELEIDLDGSRLAFSLADGQKTGLFLDQRVNCRVMDVLAPGARVFDGHSYVGLWTCRALRAGAAHVTTVDSSEPALDWARRNAEAAAPDGLDRLRFERSPVEKVLKSGEKWDVVCVDPPALAKSRASLPRALNRYQALNTDAIKAVNPGGFLVTSSCSQPVDLPAFREMLKRAARAAQRELGIVAEAGAPPDHPVLLEMPETGYLCHVVAQVR
jgi:23S rRNA (cytosine1962-C5)-methyltransferase